MKLYEIERKFLFRPCSPKRFLRSLGLKYHKHHLQQYYLPEKNGEYIRYRKSDKSYYKTVKSGDGMVREEYESPVSKKEFDKYLKRHIGKVIEKKRFVFVYRGIRYEMDKFLGALKGLCYLEIEFDNKPAAEKFVLPEIFSRLYLAEVTEDKRFTNASISQSATVPVPDSDLEVLVKRVSASIHGEKPPKKLTLEPYESSMVAIQIVIQNMAGELDRRRRELLDNSGHPDTLHRFRISIRKMRSILGLLGPFLLPKWSALHRRNLSALMDRTGSSRDIDVLLKKIPYYRSILPKQLRKELEPLKSILIERRESFDMNIDDLADGELIDYEISSLMQPKIETKQGYQAAGQPIVMTAAEIVEREIAEIIKRGKKLNADSDEKAYHKLRIRFKKIRYFIGIMKTIIEKKKYKEAIKIIKNMQITLGDFHDYQVQRSLFVSLLNEPRLQRRQTKKVLKALIRETKRLEKREEKIFRDKFIKFQSKKAIFHHLFEVY